MVRTNTIAAVGLTAGVTRVKGTNTALAVSTDGNGRYCYLNPRRGAMLAVAEAARNVACAGAVPIGATNCLNFGNPERPETMWQLVEAVEGIAEACRVMDIPITGGNVSLYNETDGRAIVPTPVIGVVGLIDDASRVVTRPFKGEGDVVIALGENLGELGGTEYLKIVHAVLAGDAPSLDLARERAVQGLVIDLAARGWLRSAHDCSDGGFAVAIAECCFDSGGIGVGVDVPGAGLRAEAQLFGESASRILISVEASKEEEILALGRRAGVPAVRIGTTGGSAIRIAIDSRVAIDVPVARAEEIWATAIEKCFSKAFA
jgi:phosphoribosylformylglycinamidine synthase